MFALNICSSHLNTNHVPDSNFNGRRGAGKAEGEEINEGIPCFAKGWLGEYIHHCGTHATSVPCGPFPG